MTTPSDASQAVELPAEWALQIAAQAWCDPTCSDIEMDERLATVFARQLTKLASSFEQDRAARAQAEPADEVELIADHIEKNWKFAEREPHELAKDIRTLIRYYRSVK